MGSFMAGEDGHITERHKRFYEERARGGVALVTVEVAAVDYPRGAAMTHQLGISDDAFIPGLRDLTERVHACGAKISLQLQHAGKVATKDLADGRPLSVPSKGLVAMEGVLEDLTDAEIAAITKNYTSAPEEIFRELDVEEIRRIIQCFADAAERARRAGFDAVEIHAGHGYLINEFLSPHCNLRRDEWGGPLENRARFLLEILHATRQRVGQDFAVWCRLDGAEVGVENGIKPDDARETAKLAAGTGANAVHVTCYGGPSGIGFSEMIVHKPAALLPYAAGIKRVVDIPVITVGRLTPEAAERALAEGQADFVAMARPLLADPALVNKLAEGRRQDIRPCIYCYRCVGQIFINERVKCTVNPATACEEEFAIVSTKEPRRVLVIGGGPAGMEAARVAAERGHRVTLCEKEERLGGTALFSSLVHPENGELVEYLVRQLARLPIEVRLGEQVTQDFVRAFRPDVTLVATGAKRQVPQVPGVTGRQVWSGDELRQILSGSADPATRRKLPPFQRSLLRIGTTLLSLSDRVDRTRALSKLWMPVGRRVVIVGGGLVGLQLAAFLVERRRDVTVLEEGPHLGPQMSIPQRWRSLHHLRGHGTRMLTNIQILAFVDEGVEIQTSQGERQTVAADTVVLAGEVFSDRELFEALGELGAEVHSIGDANEVGYIEGAMRAGAQVSREI
jgi:2,4-dienoyl-CoA reductase (NADPH2)